MAFKVDTIAKITDIKETWKIKARCIHSYISYKVDKPDERTHMDIILMDVEAFVPKAVIHRFEEKIQPGGFYYLSNFEVHKNLAGIRLTQHGFRLEFHQNTGCRPCENIPIPEYGFEFVSFRGVYSKREYERCLIDEGNIKLIQQELQYDKIQLQKEHLELSSNLTREQKNVYTEILNAITDGRGGMFFVYGYGGTGKTYIWKTLSAALRLKGEIVLNVASSGITSLLLPGGRTAHSRFAIPIELDEKSSCNITLGSPLASLLAKVKLIIWDEAPMVHKLCIQALDNSLNDIIKHSNIEGLPFGGKVVVFGGDFRQILPVVPKGSREDIVFASINSSNLWNFCKVLTLSRNMRLRMGQSEDSQENKAIKEFSDWLLKVGNGDVGTSIDGETVIELPDDLIIKEAESHIASIVDSTYPSLLENYKSSEYFEQRAIWAPTHSVVETVNDYVMSLIPGDVKEYLSSDRLCPSYDNTRNNAEIYPIDFLNTIRCSGIPNHCLKLKVGVPVMLLRNMDQASGLCNGTRLIVTQLGERVIEAKNLSGISVGMKCYIPRMVLSPSDSRLPFKFQRRQFPLLVCFAMTINKSQGQTLSNVGLYLPKPIFTHGQLYVAMSRVKSKRGLKILCTDKDGKICNETINVVYKEVFGNL